MRTRALRDDAPDSSFARNLALLWNFAHREGHSVVPQAHREQGVRLGSWVAAMRHKRQHLGHEERILLETLPGWQWDGRVDNFDRHLQLLLAFAQREGHARVPQDHVEAGVRLGTWVSNQRVRRSTLTRDRRARLEAVDGWSWDGRDDSFPERLESLRAYAAREGHARVPRTHVEAGVNLGHWVKTQRAKHKVLSAERRSMLEAIPGWTWASRDDAWVHRLELLHAYVAREGHARVPKSHLEAGVNLGHWVSTQRKLQGSLSAQRRAELEAVPGWLWPKARRVGTPAAGRRRANPTE